MIWREAIDRPHLTRERMSEDFGPWLVRLTDAIRRGQKAGYVRSDLEPEAWLTQLIVLVIGTFAAADLAAAAFTISGTDAAERQLSELIRTARHSLYIDTPSKDSL